MLTNLPLVRELGCPQQPVNIFKITLIFRYGTFYGHMLLFLCDTQ